MASEVVSVGVGQHDEGQHARVGDLHGEVAHLSLRGVGVCGQRDVLLVEDRCHTSAWNDSLDQGAALASQLAPELHEDLLVLRLGSRLDLTQESFGGLFVLRDRRR